MKCPIHKSILNRSRKWKVPDGLDPKMIRGACNDCSKYWYRAPKSSKVMTKKEVQQKFGVIL